MFHYLWIFWLLLFLCLVSVYNIMYKKENNLRNVCNLNYFRVSHKYLLCKHPQQFLASSHSINVNNNNTTIIKKAKSCIIYLQWSFSSKFPLDVTESARMNSSNSIEPSCVMFVRSQENGKEIKCNRWFYILIWIN